MNKEHVYKIGKHLFTPSANIGADWDSSDETAKKHCRTKQYTILWLRTYEPLENFVDILRTLETLDAYSYVLHDKDVNEDGSPKEPHIHAILHFPPSARIRLTTLAKLFKHNTRVEIPLDVQSCLDYELHANSPEKYQYDSSERIDHNIAVLLGSRSSSDALKQEEKEAQNRAFIDDLGTLSPFDMGVKYGRDFMKNMHRYYEFSREILAWDKISDKVYVEQLEAKADELDSLNDKLYVARASLDNLPDPSDYECILRYASRTLLNAFQRSNRLPDLSILVESFSEALRTYSRQSECISNINPYVKETVI